MIRILCKIIQNPLSGNLDENRFRNSKCYMWQVNQFWFSRQRKTSAESNCVPFSSVHDFIIPS